MCKPEKVLRIRNDRIRETTAILYFAHKVIIKDLFLSKRRFGYNQSKSANKMESKQKYITLSEQFQNPLEQL